MSRSQALKTMRFAAELRSNLALMKRSKLVTNRQYSSVRSDCVHYLAHQNLIYPPSMTGAGLSPDQSYSERCQVLRLPETREKTIEEQQFMHFLETSQRSARRSTWIWRFGEQAVDMQERGWFGFFITLTVDPLRVPDSQAMWKENREFRKYIRRIARIAAKASGHPRAIQEGASVNQFVRYGGVIEHGKSRHHHHMHLLLWMREVPASWKICPNRGISDPRFRINDWCKPLSTLWPHSLPGIGRAKYFRHEADVWSRLGFVLPYDPKKKRTIRINPPQKAGVYIAKYMDKEDKSWQHRIKSTRGLGLSRIKRALTEMALQKVEALTWRPRSYDLNATLPTIHCVPSVLVRSLAKQELFCRKWANNSLDYQKLLQPNTDVFSGMLKSVRDGTRPQRMRSKEFYDWVTQHLPEPAGYSESRIYRAAHSLAVDFPPDKSLPAIHIGCI